MKIKDIIKLCRKATSGPWYWSKFKGSPEALRTQALRFQATNGESTEWLDGYVLDLNFEGFGATSDDLTFIARSRTLMPVLANLAEAADKACKELTPENDESEILSEIRTHLATLTSTKFKYPA